MTRTLSLDKLMESLGIRYERNVPLGPLTWYGLGGPASLMVHPSDGDQLSTLMAKCGESEVPVRVLGGGANLLVSDQGVNGVVVRLDDPLFKQISFLGESITVGAGFDLPRLVIQLAKKGLGGLEVLAGIPATVGGAIRMNAGGVYGDIGQSVRRITICDRSGRIKVLDRSDLVFGYRTSNISDCYILEVQFELIRDDPDRLIGQVKEIFKHKKNSQPLRASSAGCAFKNPQNLVNHPCDGWSAGQLIDKAGLKGHRIGDAEVSCHHANFVIAYPGCTASDVLALLNHIRQTVLDRFDLDLEREVVVWS